eukprot:4140886-Pleurochrysis_carterae.AAC.1
MSADDATRYMHQRLHAGATRLRNLPNITADAPSSLAKGHFRGCDACTEANATRHTHDYPLPRIVSWTAHTCGHRRSIPALFQRGIPVRASARG